MGQDEYLGKQWRQTPSKLRGREGKVEDELDGFNYGHKIRGIINSVRKYKERKQAASLRKMVELKVM